MARPLLWTAFLVLLMAGGLALWLARRQRIRTGLPGGRIIYADTTAWTRCREPLYAERYRLAGKPDYLVQDGIHRIPVEVKPGRQAERPYASDIYQLGVYCLLVEETWRRPPYGLIRYRSATFRVPYTRQLRSQLLSLLAEMRRKLQARDVRPNHRDPERCLRCGYRHVCNAKLAQAPRLCSRKCG